MKFYQVTKDYTVYKNNGDNVNGYNVDFIQHELITQKELNRLIQLKTQMLLIDFGVLIEIQHSTRDCYWSFGARFKMSQTITRGYY